jgi:GTP-binding protein Era
MKASFIALVGRPSTGKSTFINQVCGEKISIVSGHPQTTRNRVRGIYNSKEGQLVFVDTPGFYQSEQRFNRHLKGLLLSTLKDVDQVLYLLDVSRRPGEEENELLELLAAFKGPLIIALNKIDIKKNYRHDYLELIKDKLKQVPIHEISALTGSGVESLAGIILLTAPNGEPFYPLDYYTDQSPEFRISEVVREKTINLTRQEIPHQLYVEVADMEMQNQGTQLWARIFICVERDSQKGIVVGKKGELIRDIVRQATQELNGLFPYQVKLDVRVKVRPKWRKNEQLLKKLIS